jgi:hypothetical protein
MLLDWLMDSIACFAVLPHACSTLAAQALGCARQLPWNAWQLLQEVMEWLQTMNLVAL